MLGAPRGAIFSPKPFGWGWTLNLAHPGSWAPIATLLPLAAGVALVA